MKKLSIVLFILVAFFGCAHSGEVEETSIQNNQQAHVHIHDTKLQAGDRLVVNKVACADRQGFGEKMGPRQACRSTTIGCAKVLEKKGETSFLVELDQGLVVDPSFLFDRPKLSSICLK